MFLLVLSLSALAQSPTDEPIIRIPAIQVIDDDEFSGIYIEGELVGPDGIGVTERRAMAPMNWIELRRDFRAELRESLSELK